MGCNDFIRQLEGGRRDREVRLICDCKEIGRERNHSCGCRTCPRHNHHHNCQHHRNRKYICRCKELRQEYNHGCRCRSCQRHHNHHHHGHHHHNEHEYVCRCKEQRH